MIITCWGARGSIPVCGSEYLKHGGATTCLEIRTKNDEIIIVDAGSGIRGLGHKLLRENRRQYNLILTHSHWDHILGFPFFRPIFVAGTTIDLYGCSFAQASIKRIVARTMDPPHFPIKFEEIRAEIACHGACRESFEIDAVQVTPVFLSHPNGGIGLKFVEDGKSFVFLTDNELTYRHPGGLDYEDYVAFSAGADLLFHDAEFTDQEYVARKTWGHSVYRDALKLALEAGVGRFGLFHHNQDRTDAALEAMVQDCQRIVRESGADLDCFAVAGGMEIELQ
jgi:ribonuclease BN (tRNA processing enzyme)